MNEECEKNEWSRNGMQKERWERGKKKGKKNKSERENKVICGREGDETEMSRKSFQWEFTMTINKSQGQSLKYSHMVNYMLQFQEWPGENVWRYW